MAGLKMPQSANRGGTGRAYPPATRPTEEEPLVVPEMSLSERIEDCKRRQAGFLARGGDVPMSMIREMENLLQEAANVKA